jgi:hypothetical protein
MTVQLPETVTIDLESLTLGDLEDVENLTGMGFSALVNAQGGLPMKGLRALAYVTVRRDFPDVTFEDCRGFAQGAIRVKEDAAQDQDPTPSPEGDGEH